MASKKQRKRKQSQRKNHRPGKAQELMRSLLDPGAPSALTLRKLWGSSDGIKLQKEFRSRVLAAMPYVADAQGGRRIEGVFPPAEAWDYLDAIHSTLAERVSDLVADRGSAEWLWWLRRLSGQFDNENSFTSTGPYVQALAEVVAAGISRPSQPRAYHPTFEFGLDDQTLTDLAWLREVSVLLYKLHATMKRCAKGQRVVFGEGTIPRWEPSDDLDDAIEDYDYRTERQSANWLQAVGVAAPPDPGINASHLRVGGLVPYWHSIVLGDPPAFDKADPTPTFLDWIDLDQAGAFRDQEVLTEVHVSLIALLWACFNIATREPERMQVGMTTPLQWGYMVTPTQRFLRPALDEVADWLAHGAGGAAVAGCWQPSSADEILEVLAGVKPEVWPPLCGNPIHEAGEHSLVDLLGASRRLFTTLVRPTDGTAVNHWSGQFEADVQAVIDSSPWRPEGKLRELVGRSIQRDGRAFTDIDAVAHSGDRLLLVSCKSIAFTVPALRGEHAVTRNIVDKIHDAASEWSAITARVQSEPDLLGVGFKTSPRIDGCVVFPSVPFYTEQEWRHRRPFDAIPYLLSISELGEGLGGR